MRIVITLKRVVPFLVLLPIGILLLGYWLQPPPEVIPQRSTEQDAILLYSDKTQTLEKTMRTFEDSWALAHAQKNHVKIGELLTTGALPALEILVDSLDAASPELEPLQAIHLPLQKSYKKLLGQMRTLCSTSDKTAFMQQHERVTSAMGQLLQGHRKYAEEIRAFYAVNNVYPPEKTADEPVPDAPDTRISTEEAESP